MLPRIVLITGVVLMLMAPTVGAATPDCAKNPPKSGQAWPLNPDLYFYVGAPSATGFWQESNGHDGLQVNPCVGANGVHLYEADTYLGAVVPPGALL